MKQLFSKRLQYRRWLGDAALLCVLLLGWLPQLHAQNVIPLGAGSYAEYPPVFEAAKPNYTGTDAWGDLTQKFIHRKWFVVDTTTRALPTTDWWTSLIDQQYSGNLWAYPGMVQAADYGLYVEFPKTLTVSSDGGTAKMTSRSRLTIGGTDFAPKSALARRWGAWTLDWIMQDAVDPSRQFAVTIGHGLPFTWVETTKVSPTISVDSASFFKDDGSPQTFPVTTDHFGIQTKGDHYGIFAPPNTQFTWDGKVLRATFASANGYLVVGTMTKASDLSTFNTYAYTIPRDSKVSWVYDEPTAKMSSTWELVNENLRGGTQLNQIQGWLPHSYKKTTRNFAFNGLEYATARGKLKCAVGTKFTVTYDFNGIVPGYPEPEVIAGQRHPYRPAVMKEIIDQYQTVSGYRDDTYWGGKNVLDYARYMQLAAQSGDTQAFNTLKKKLKEALTDWFTYTPGESAHYFSLYPNVGSFLGHRTRDNDLPGIDVLQDHAFCYGYHVYAAALLMMYDEDFKAKYKDMAKMLVLDYANYNRNDKRFPFFRSMDPWAGHSYSGGMGDNNGNGEESSSEGMQAWGAMYLLGEVTGDKPLRDAGIFGYVQEAQGVAEYWFDRSHIPANGSQGNYDYTKWKKPYCSNLVSGGIGWWTYFSGDPFWMHSIQWIPMSPLTKYMYEDVPFAKWDWETMWNTKQGTGWEGDLGDKGDVGALALSYFQISNPDSAAAIYDNLWDNNRGMAHAKDNNAFTYWYTHSHRTLGEIQWNQHTNMPSSTVYFNARLNRTTVLVYNTNATEKVVDVYKDGVKYASFTAPPKKLTAHHLDAALKSVTVTAPTKTVAPGQTLQLTAQGYDQYGAKVNATVTWSVSGGGTISASGLFTAGTTVGNYVVSAKTGTITGQYSLRVNTAPVLTTIALSPTITRGEIGKTYQLTAKGLDQYGDSLAITPTWTLSGGGSISSTGLFTPTTPGGPFTLKAASGSVSKSIPVTVSYPLMNIALGKPATATSSNATNILTYLNDGDLGTRWESDYVDAQTVTINLGGQFDLDKVVLTWEAAYSKVYNLQISTDNVTYTPLYSQPSGNGGREELAVTGRGQYIRLNMQQRGTTYGNSLYEFEVYGSPPQTGGAVLSTLLLSPGVVSMKDNVTQQFTVKGYDQYGALVNVTPTWKVIGKGSISATGLYTPNGGGVYLQPSFTVTATANNLVAKATVVVEETPKLMKLDIQPITSAANRIEMAQGSSRQFTYLAKDQFDVPYAGSITWTASGGGSIAADGTFTANQLGDWMIFGKNGAISDTAYVTVKAFADVNLATYKPTKTSSVENNDPNSAGAFAVDKNMATRWTSQYADPQWLYVDLQGAYKLNKVVVNWEAAYGTSYDIEIANDPAGPWSLAKAVTGSDGGQDIVTFPETAGRYVRITGKTRATGYGYSIFEFQVYGTGLAGNQLPTVVLTSPANNAAFTSLVPITLSANAADADGSVAKVEFYAGATLVGSDNTAPYSVAWTPTAAGSYSLTARAYDNVNAVTTSTAVNVTVTTSTPAGLTIPGKIESESYSTMSGIQTEATADTDGGQNIGYIDAGDYLDYNVSVTTAGTYNVSFRVAGWNTAAQLQVKSGATVLATVNVPNTGGGQVWATTTPVSLTLPTGNQTLRVAFVTGGFNLNYMTFSTNGVANQNPTVALTSPANNATFVGLSPITLSANAADTDGSVAKVEFYAGATLVGTDNTSPFSVSWAPAATGSYALTAKAYDNLNAATTSTTVNVTVTASTPAGLTIPGKIESESYSTMSGIQAEATADTGGGQNIGYIDAGDWMDYNVSVTTAGTYNVSFRVAGWNTAAQLQVKSGTSVLATVNVPNTGGGQIWTSTVPVSLTLPAGNQTLRVALVTGGFNLNYMTFNQGAARGALASKSTAAETVYGYPNPTDQVFHLSGFTEGATVVITDAAGRQVQTATLRNGVVDVHQLSAGMYILTATDGQTTGRIKMLKK
jgi:endoglucanase Acf2